jgi:N-sulfoglucosamine sulfohydrolase
MDRPNIILLTTHDTGQHVSPYGIKTVHTPNCERLASESVLFENSFCTAPQCSPSRASLVTGRYPHSNGTMGLTHADFAWSLHVDEQPIASLLGGSGYTTWLLGGQHETNDPSSLGFDHVDIGFTLLDLPAHIEPLLDQRDLRRPFYCQIGCFETHRPFDGHGTEPDDSLGIYIPPYLRDGPETRDELRKMQGLVRRFDTGLGQLLGILDDRDLCDNTILVVTTDHGIAFPRAKGTLFDPGLETMLFVRWPARFEGGLRRKELISHVDILPTLLEAIGVPCPDCIQGQSFLLLLEGKTCAERSEIFAEKTFHDCYDPMRCIRTRTHKYICYFEKSSLHPVPGDIIGGGANRELGPLSRQGNEALYDLTSDPGEKINRVDDPDCREIVADLRRRLHRWMQETGDPLLEGPVASPFYERACIILTEGQSHAGEQGVPGDA